MQDASARLTGRRRLTAYSPQPRRPLPALPMARKRGTLPARLGLPTGAVSVIAGSVLMTLRAPCVTGDAPRNVAADTVAQEGQMITVPHVAMPPNLPDGIPTHEAIRDDVRLSGLNVRRRTASRQLRLQLQAQRGIAAGINPRLLPTSDAFPRRAIRAPSSADDGPRVDRKEAIEPRRTVTKRCPVLVHTAPIPSARARSAPARAAASCVPRGTAHGTKATTLARVPIPATKPVHAVGQALHTRVMTATGHASRLRINGPERDVLPTEHPTDARSQVVRAGDATTPSLEVTGAALGRATQTRLRPRKAANEARRFVPVTDEPTVQPPQARPSPAGPTRPAGGLTRPRLSGEVLVTAQRQSPKEGIP